METPESSAPPPEQKTLIYVVMKKPGTTNANLQGPTTKKPEVYFIQYKVPTKTVGPDDETEQEILPGGYTPEIEVPQYDGYIYTRPTTTTTTTTTTTPEPEDE